jgi:3-oxoacyl-[acyl-carrier-protein] synthase III
LSKLHKELKLSSETWTIPITNDYSNYNSCLLIADSLIKAGRAKNILICIGGNWTRNVSYHTPQSISAGDGAGAAVMSMSGDTSKWSVIDTSTISDTNYYGGMYTGRDPFVFDPPHQGHKVLYSDHYFHINEMGQEGFKKFGIEAASNSILQLLKKQEMKSSEITLMPNQSSSVLIDAWLKAIKPGQNFDTITTFANMTVATTGVNFAFATEQDLVKHDNLVLMGLGPDMHANAILLKRSN